MAIVDSLVRNLDIGYRPGTGVGSDSVEAWDVAIIGGGILGTSVSYWIGNQCQGRIAVLEKEGDVKQMLDPVAGLAVGGRRRCREVSSFPAVTG